MDGPDTDAVPASPGHAGAASRARNPGVRPPGRPALRRCGGHRESTGRRHPRETARPPGRSSAAGPTPRKRRRGRHPRDTGRPTPTRSGTAARETRRGQHPRDTAPLPRRQRHSRRPGEAARADAESHSAADALEGTARATPTSPGAADARKRRHSRRPREAAPPPTARRGRRGQRPRDTAQPTPREATRPKPGRSGGADARERRPEALRVGAGAPGTCAGTQQAVWVRTPRGSGWSGSANGSGHDAERG